MTNLELFLFHQMKSRIVRSIFKMTIVCSKDSDHKKTMSTMLSLRK